MWRCIQALGSVIMLGSCASVQPITGGEPDIHPPTLVSATPLNRSTLFAARSIRLLLDERIQLDRARDRILVSPPLEQQPEVRMAGPRSVEILLNSPLEPNTTYSFNLTDCVKDLTEGNVAAGLNYVVSTGPELDSALITGSVVNALTGAPEKEMAIGLYAPGDTLSFRTGRPAYVTRSNALGLFSISDLPHGRYLPLALRDRNNNLRYDLPNEEIALHDGIVTLAPEDTAAPFITLRAFLPASDRQLVRGCSVTADGALEVLLARPADSLFLQDVARTGGRLSWYAEYNRTRDSILFWPSDTTLLGEGLYQLNSSTGVLDSLRFRRTRAMPFHNPLQARRPQQGEPGTIELLSGRPIASINPALIQLRSMGKEIPFEVKHGPNERRALLTHPTQDPAPVELLVLPKAVVDIYGGRNDTLRTNLGATTPDGTGSLSVVVSGLSPGNTYLLQLLDAQQRPVVEAALTSDSPMVKWDRLAPGLRSLRLVNDRNGNGRWDTGTWRTMEQPERTWPYAEPVNMRAAWEIKVEWDIAPH